tara:strand:+ start:703 stop:915 length:213 start_codon:yes stop_codon:yes gene_type:complete
MSLIINKIFSGVAKVLENLTIKKLSKTDPELANEFRELQKTKKEVDNYLTKEEKQAIERGEKPEFMKKFK